MCQLNAAARPAALQGLQLAAYTFVVIVSFCNKSVNMILPAFTAERHAAGCSAVAIGRLSLAIDISYLHGAQQQTRRCRPMR